SFLLFLITVLFDRRLVILNLFASFWASLYIWLMPLWSVHIEGRQKLSLSKQYIFVSNHQSQLDILVLFGLFFPFRWVSKTAVFKLPFIGWNMLLNGYVKLKRGDKKSIEKMMDECERLLDKKCSLFLFPEGTRSKTGILKPFKPGAFILAKKKRIPIQPVVINNTKDALPKHTLHFHGRHEIEVKILDEIPCSAFIHMEEEKIAGMVQSLIALHVKEHQARNTAN
ncbi:MAG: 1-acyl-sn-glycerol-3-phosphate acyltransferase, partial [Desulfobacteraceae bacterium]|nr:1-acyl-sn-glycerol-3-phosphate acyltransferase [Desulfobacteraceae bacterium]